MRKRKKVVMTVHDKQFIRRLFRWALKESTFECGHKPSKKAQLKVYKMLCKEWGKIKSRRGYDES